MKKVLVAAIGLVWATASYGSDLGKGAVGQGSWVGKDPNYFLNMLPQPPRDGFPGTDDDIKPFRQKFLQAQKELQDEIGKRQRALKKWNEQNSKKMMENAVDMPGFEGKSQAEMKKMSKAERKKMAEKMMQEKFGVSMDDLKAQKKANKEGKTMANVDFAKTMAGEMQVNDMMKSKGQREADKKKIADAGKLAKEQADLSKKLYGAVEGRAAGQLEELEYDEHAKSLREGIYDQMEIMAKLKGEAYKRPPKEVDLRKLAEILKYGASQGEPGGTMQPEEMDQGEKDLQGEMDAAQNSLQSEAGGGKGATCQEKEDQCSRIHSEKKAYCRYMAPKLEKILNEWRSSLLTSQSRYKELDRITGELQKTQTGIGLPDASLGLSGLEALKRYAVVLGYIYRYNPGQNRCKGLFCGGEESGYGR